MPKQGSRIAMWIATNAVIGIAIWVTGSAWPLLALIVPLLVDLVDREKEGK